MVDMSKRKLSDEEKLVITMLDASETRRRTATYESIMTYMGDETLRVHVGERHLICSPMTILSLVGKGLVRIKYGRVSLKLVVYKRSVGALYNDGYFDDVPIEDHVAETAV